MAGVTFEDVKTASAKMGQRNCFGIVTQSRTFYMCGRSEKECWEWLGLLEYVAKQATLASTDSDDGDEGSIREEEVEEDFVLVEKSGRTKDLVSEPRTRPLAPSFHCTVVGTHSLQLTLLDGDRMIGRWFRTAADDWRAALVPRLSGPTFGDSSVIEQRV